MPAPKRFQRIIGLVGMMGLLLLLASALQGCSAIRLAYNNSPDLAYWYLDGYADFNGAQSLQAKNELEKIQVWHRQTQLPAYIDLLQKVKLKMPSDLDAAQVCEVFDDARRKLLAVSDRAQPAVVAVAATLRPAQITHMERKFEKGNEKYRDDYLDATPKSSRAKRYKEAVKRAEMLYGSLGDKQLERIGDAIDQSSFNAAVAYAERIRRQRDILQTLRTVTAVKVPVQANIDPIKITLSKLIERAVSSPNATYQSYFEKLTQDGCRSFAELHNATSPAQRARAVATINGYQEDLKVLATAQPES